MSASSHPYCCSKAIHDALKNASPSVHAWFDSKKGAVGLGKFGPSTYNSFAGSDSPGGPGHNLSLYYQNGKIPLWAQSLVPTPLIKNSRVTVLESMVFLPPFLLCSLTSFFLSTKTKPLLYAKHWSRLYRRKAKIILELLCKQWLTSMTYLPRAKCLLSTLYPSCTFVDLSSMNVSTCSLSLVIFVGWNNLLGLKSSSLDFSFGDREEQRQRQ